MRYTPISAANIKAKAKLFKNSLAKTGRDVPLTVCQNHLSRALGYSGWAEFMNGIASSSQNPMNHSVPDFVSSGLRLANDLRIPNTLGFGMLLRLGLFPTGGSDKTGEFALFAERLESDLPAGSKHVDLTARHTQSCLDHLTSIDLAFERFMELNRKPKPEEMLAINHFISKTSHWSHFARDPKSSSFPEIIFDMSEFAGDICSAFSDRPGRIADLNFEEDHTVRDIASQLPKSGLLVICGPTGNGSTTAAMRLLHHLSKTRRVSTSSALVINHDVAKPNNRSTVYNLSKIMSSLSYMKPETVLELAENNLVITHIFALPGKVEPKQLIAHFATNGLMITEEQVKRIVAGTLDVKYGGVLDGRGLAQDWWPIVLHSPE
ncbi:hypothetical protein [Mesorhizobium sp. SP-1A]|uniref:hypothetical protein n=1 Tax=Mesorhizobium sp. SP-1A TaxID=3077840 RepID=UPI0028F71950|nr:hypothetical protein [Mesorhizobium sp. SP-1A]